MEPERLSRELKMHRNATGIKLDKLWHTEEQKTRGVAEQSANEVQSKQDEKASKGPGPWISTGILSNR